MTMSDLYKSGFVGILGWTNVGKSTLINKLTGMKISITADCPQTTRRRLMGIVQGDGYQIAFMDTPGLHKPQNRLSKLMIKTAWGTIDSMDAILWLVFPDRDPVMQFDSVKNQLKALKIPLIIGINKIDLTPRESLLPLISKFHELVQPQAIVPFSALTGENLNDLEKAIVEILPENAPLFPEDQVTDQSERIIAGDMVREKIIELTFQEMPHVIAVGIESFTEDEAKNKIFIEAVVYVEKSSQKGIVIGKQGSMIKKIGIAARRSLEDFFGRKIDLRLWVKVSKKWRDDPVCLGRFDL